MPLVGVGLFYRGGYFTQGLAAEGRQTETYEELDPEALGLVREPVDVEVELAGETVTRRGLALRRRLGPALPPRRRPAHGRALLRRPRAPDPPGAAARRRRRARARRARARAERLPRQRGPLGLPRDRARARARRGRRVHRRRARAHPPHRRSSRRTRRSRPATRSSATSSSLRYVGDLARRRHLEGGAARARPRAGHRRLRPDAARAAPVRRRERRLGAARRGRARDVGGALARGRRPIGFVTNGVHLGTWLAPELDRAPALGGRAPGGAAARGELGRRSSSTTTRSGTCTPRARRGSPS